MVNYLTGLVLVGSSTNGKGSSHKVNSYWIQASRFLNYCSVYEMRVFPCGICLGVMGLSDGLTSTLINSNDENKG